MMRQVRHEDNIKINRSLVGSAQSMLQYQLDMNKKARDIKRAERRERNVQKKFKKD